MKKVTLLILMFFVLFLNCSEIVDRELYDKTDYLVESLQTTYESYGIMNEEHFVYTSDSLYQIMPTGRLVIVKIRKYVDDAEYKELRQDLENHYINDVRVNEVYINQGGTVVIDCRN